MKIKLATVNLEVADVGRSKALYMDVLGMAEDVRRSHPPDFAYLTSAGCHLTLATAREATEAGPTRSMELGFEADDLAAMKARLESHGIRDYREESMGWGSALELRDPDGHRVIIYRFAAGEEGRPA